MKNLKYIILPLLATLICFTSCDETLGIVDNNLNNKVQAPQVESFYPQTGSAGTEILITGVGFSEADSVQINGVTSKIKNKISDSQILIELTGMESSGKIKVFNLKGSAESSETFTVIDKAPENVELSVEASDILASGMQVDVTGQNLKTIQNIYLSGSTDRKATILFQTDEKITFTVPVICDPTAKIKLEYYEKATAKYWESDAYATNKTIVPPVVISCPGKAYLGQVLLIDVTNADRIDSVYFGTENLTFKLISNTQISVSLPTNLTSNASANLWMLHNACESDDIMPDFQIVIPTFYTYFDLHLTAHGGNGGSTGATGTGAFFDAEGGGTYTTCQAVEHPGDIEFATYSNNSGAFVFYGPQSLTSGTIKNYYCGTTSLSSLMNLTVFNAVTVKFRVLDATSAEQKVIIDMFNSNDISDLSDALFGSISVPATNNISYFKSASGNSAYKPGDIIWFKNSSTGKNGLMRVNSVDYSGIVQDKFSSAQADILYQK